VGDRYAQVSGTKEIQRGKEPTLVSSLIRWGALAALASGLLWIAAGLLTLAHPHTPPDVLGTRLDYLGTSVFSAAYLGVLGGLVGLRARQVDSYGSLGEAGFLLAFVGAALLCMGQAASAIFAGNSTLGWLLEGPGYGLMVAMNLLLAGLVVLGIATLRARVLASWCGLALIGVVVVSVFGAIVSTGLAFVAVGVLWMALGYALYSERSASVGQLQSMGGDRR
jgi:hypothetical protein